MVPIHFRLFTVANFFTPAVEKIVTRKEVSASGMSLHQLAQVLTTYPVAVAEYYASPTTVDEFRSRMSAALGAEDSHMLVNYLRSSLGQETGGHISPLGAFNANADRVLILDTSSYKYPWVWVRTDDLWKAMSDADPGSGV